MTTPKPEPASEAPKVGSEGPIDWEKAELWAAGTAQGDARLSQVQAARALLALRAEVEELKADKERRKGSAVDRLHNLCDGFDEMDKEQQAKIDALRAELAAAKELEELESMLLRKLMLGKSV